MARNIIQDVIVKNKKSIRQIPVNRIRRPAEIGDKKIFVKDSADNADKEIKTARLEKPKKTGRKDFQKLVIWIIAMLSLGFFLFALSSYLSIANVTVTPKMARVLFNDSYTVKKNASSGELQYEIMTLQKKISKQLEATEEKKMQIKASGKITVYNNFTTAPQKFIKNTRLESTNGLIYKIPESIVVPGKTVVSGEQIPGSIETVVFADEAGDKYNVKVSSQKDGDFRIVGLKGDKKYNYFYGRIKSDITGGVNGLVKKVASKTYEGALSELRTKLKSELVKEARSTKPESAVLFEDTYFIDFVSLPDKALGDNKIEITENAVFYVVMFDKVKLNSYVADKKITNLNGAPVELVFDDNAKISISNDTKSKPWESDTLNLNIKGEANIVWAYDKAVLQKSLSGYSKNDLNKFLSTHPEFSDVSFKIRPFWKRAFPADPKKIKIISSSAK